MGFLVASNPRVELLPHSSGIDAAHRNHFSIHREPEHTCRETLLAYGRAQLRSIHEVMAGEGDPVNPDDATKSRGRVMTMGTTPMERP